MNQTSLGSFTGVLESRSFLYLWMAQALSQTALNATIYVLLVRVQEQTGSTTALGLLILSFIVPSVLMGVAAGVFVDRWQKKRVLLITNLLRAVIVLSFAILAQDLWLILLVNLTYSAVSQFFLPAELAAIPAVVPENQLIRANGLFNLTLSSAQLAGFVIIGPILVKGLGGPAVFILLALVYALCAALIWFMRMEEPELRRAGLDLKGGWFRPVVSEWQEGLRLLARDSSISLSILHLTLMNSLILVIGMLAPGYVSRVLGIGAADSVFIMAPAGVGMLAGISLLPRLAQQWPKELLANIGVFVTAGVLYFLALVGQLGQLPGATGLLPRLSLITLPAGAGPVMTVMGLALVLGFGYALVNVSAQTLVQQRVPFELRGRVFATQMAFANTAAILPLVFLGSLADLIGISEVTLFAATILLLAGFFSSTQTRRAHPLSWEQD